jgi:LIVCS family branched-chain amino acid:cation transporter
MKDLSKKDLMFISLMFFSMFFGAGNLIFPPYMGQLSGSSMWIALGGFIISAVGFPILGVIAVSKTGGLHELSSRVHPIFAIIFTVILYLALGPFLAIPRAGSLAFEMGISPILPASLQTNSLSLFIFIFLYFLLAYWLCLKPSQLVDRFGKILTPILLILIASIFICSLLNPIGSLGTPKGDYTSFPFFKGFLEGYMTMDAIAALNYGIVISTILMMKGVKDEKKRTSYSVKCGLVVGFLLTMIYGILTYLGASSQNIAMNSKNGAQTLTHVVLFLFGKPGVLLLGLIFALACLTTSVGLITSCSEYFSKVLPKISYKTWVTLLSALSMLLANMGLTKILSVSVPVLNAIYPMTLILILLSILHNFFNGYSSVYACTMLFTGIISITDSLNQVGLSIVPISNILKYLPLYSKGLGWIIPAIIGTLIGFVFKFSKTLILNKRNFEI